MDPVRGQALMIAGFIEIALAAMSVLMVANWRRSPWDICALVTGTLFLGIFFVVAAGIHADSVAGAVTC